MPVDFRCDTVRQSGVEVLVLLQVSDRLLDLGRELHGVILLLELMHMHRLEESILEQTRSDRAEPGVWRWEEDARDVNDISRVGRASKGTIQMNRHRPRDMPDRHLIGHLLDLDLLEWPETTRSSLHVQLPVGAVLDALLGWAGSQRGESFLRDLLEDLVAA